MREQVKVLEYEAILAPDLLHFLFVRINDTSVLVCPCSLFPKIDDLAAIHFL